MSDSKDIEVIKKSITIATENLTICIEFLKLMKEVDLSNKLGNVDLSSILENYNFTIQQLNSVINLLQAMESIITTQIERLSIFQSAFEKANTDLQKLIKTK